MFKKTTIAAAVALTSISGLAFADIEYSAVDVVADDTKLILPFEWSPTDPLNGNSSAIDQWGWGNKATTNQTAGGEASSLIGQEGRNNTAVTTQDASASTSTVIQIGRRNDASVDLSLADESVSFLQQTGEDHYATVSVTGEYNYSEVLQDGSYQVAA